MILLKSSRALPGDVLAVARDADVTESDDLRGARFFSRRERNRKDGWGGDSGRPCSAPRSEVHMAQAVDLRCAASYIRLLGALLVSGHELQVAVRGQAEYFLRNRKTITVTGQK